jgi:GT2 family glycosyltransferase
LSRLDVSVVVPSHGRELRLWWLLNALEEQSLDAGRYEVVLVHDYDDPRFLDLLDHHPLAGAGRLRAIRLDGCGPARKRNVGWQEARADLVAFTDDDCRPDEGWLAALLEVAATAPEAIVQGTTRPDPLEQAVMAAPHYRTVRVDPPHIHANTCNIAYPRRLLERVGGFDESLPAAAGEDTDLAVRAREAGAEIVAAPVAFVFHAVEEYSLPDVVRMNWRWQHLVLVIVEHPQLREELVAGVFWRKSHAELTLALAGLALARRRPVALGLAVPYLRRSLRRRGRRPRARLAAALELPGQLAADLAELATMVRGSIRYRTPML